MEDFPFWPAKKTIAKDDDLEQRLNHIGRCLVSLVGESGGLRVVKMSEIKPFTGQPLNDQEDETVDISKEMKTSLDECMAMSRRILRGRQDKRRKSK